MQCNEIEGNPYDRRKKTHRKMGFSFCSSDEAKQESSVCYIAPRLHFIPSRLRSLNYWLAVQVPVPLLQVI